MIRRLTTLALSGLAFGLGALALTAQQAGTTGEFCVNNFCIGPFMSESTSCTDAPFPGGTTTNLVVETSTPGLPVMILYSGVNACSPSTLCLNAALAPLQFTPCNGTTNQSLDIVPGGAPPIFGVSQPTTIPNCGLFVQPVTLPPGLDMAVQGVIFDPILGGSFGTGNLKVLMTQAYQVTT